MEVTLVYRPEQTSYARAYKTIEFKSIEELKGKLRKLLITKLIEWRPSALTNDGSVVGEYVPLKKLDYEFLEKATFLFSSSNIARTEKMLNR